jgi:hypothetical protein
MFYYPASTSIHKGLFLIVVLDNCAFKLCRDVVLNMSTYVSLTVAHSVWICGAAYHHCQLRGVGVGRASTVQRQDHSGSETGKYKSPVLKVGNGRNMEFSHVQKNESVDFAFFQVASFIVCIPHVFLHVLHIQIHQFKPNISIEWLTYLFQVMYLDLCPEIIYAPGERRERS